MSIKIPSKLIAGLYILTMIFWSLFVISTHYSASLEGWRFMYLLKPFLIGMTVIPIIGGVYGIHNAMRWGVKSIMGLSTIAVSLGMLAWGGGMVIWNYYLFFTTTSVPYPSLADVIFILSWPFWTFGIFQLSKAFGIRFALKKVKKSFYLIPAIIAILSVYLLVYVARGGISYENPLKLFFDLFYPLGDIVILSATASVYVALRTYMGGIYKKPAMLLLFGFFVNYAGDFLFAYTTTKGTYFNGHLSDLLYVTSMFILSLGLSKLTPDAVSVKEAISI